MEPTKPIHPENETAPAAGDNGVAPRELTPEEQMALYEKELKETDWGHQPC
jgi:hypothetical protein